MQIRCIVTGQNETGKSVVMRTTPIEPVTLALFPGYEFHRVWGSDSVPAVPSDGNPPAQPSYFPPKNGFRFGFFTIPPDTMTRIDQIATAQRWKNFRESCRECSKSWSWIIRVCTRPIPWTSTSFYLAKCVSSWMTAPRFFSKLAIA